MDTTSSMEMTQGTRRNGRCLEEPRRHPLLSWRTCPSRWSRCKRKRRAWWGAWIWRRSSTSLSSFVTWRLSQPCASTLPCWLKAHDEVMTQPHAKGKQRPGIGSEGLVDSEQPARRATHHCPECFTDWPLLWDPTMERSCVCGKKVTPIKKTKHLTTMDGKTHRWLLFVTGNGITWTQDGCRCHPDAAHASELAAHLTSADVPSEEAFHPKRSEQEMMQAVEDNANIIHDLQVGALSVEDPCLAWIVQYLVAGWLCTSTP